MFKQWDPLLQWRRRIYLIQFNTRKSRKWQVLQKPDSKMVSAASQVFRMKTRFISLFIEKNPNNLQKKPPSNKQSAPTLKHSKFNGEISFFLIMDNDYTGSVSSLHFILRPVSMNQ